MESRRLMWFTATILLGVMATPVQLSAQEKPSTIITGSSTWVRSADR
jgi:hypothetical protein